jgi:hydroxymethylbilane synthase
LQSPEITIGTRGSALALAQAEQVRRRLADRGLAAYEAIAIVPIRTTGDRITDRSLVEAGGKGLFTKEIDEDQLARKIDIAVHSAKDLPTRLPDGLAIAACLKREDVRDAFISTRARRLAELPAGAVLGTSSLRRKALALRERPDLRVVDLRGNVETRLRKIEDGVADATLLAQAGLIRLGLADRAISVIETDDWLPAVGQGIIAVVARSDDRRMRTFLGSVDHRDTSIALSAERAYLSVLDGSCRTPIGGLARSSGETVDFRGIIVKPDGSDVRAIAVRGPAREAQSIGIKAGQELARLGGPGFFTAA